MSLLRVRAIAAACAIAIAGAAGAQQFRLPRHPRPVLFGSILIQRTTGKSPIKPVAFSHWSHRLRYTCRVCHLELDFAFMTNATEITEDANRKGAYCGACHDGRTAFGHAEENCAKCHTGTIESVPDGFLKLDDLPKSKFGNGIDWSRALANGDIHPAASLTGAYKPMALDTTLSLDAEWNFVPPATFPHAEHVRWLDCANCHPSIFNIKKKTTRHFSMRLNLTGQFCGTCHLRVAFPLDDCQRCHPAMERQPSLDGARD